MLRLPTEQEKRRRRKLLKRVAFCNTDREIRRPLRRSAALECPQAAAVPHRARRRRRSLRMNAPESPPIRLTRFSHGGGCGCKIAPGVLQRILGDLDATLVPKALLVGIETADDAAVYQLNERQAIVATTDFFMPIVDDPFDFGAIAATNAISDVYAMGATPLFALAIVGMPVDALPLDVIRRILEGGESACARAGIPVAGGHTIDAVEPIYGLVAIGVVDPRHLKRNASARAGDAIILGKPLGVGVCSAAHKRDALAADRYEALLASTTKLNTPGIALGVRDDVHALTDVTGFGLLGHLLEMCRGARVGADIDFARIPLLPGALALAGNGFVTGASRRNFDAYGNDVALAATIGERERALLTDPQTSGGLLVACAPAAIDPVLAIFRQEGFAEAACIGRFVAGEMVIRVA
jgi:selenide, water dikinase